MRVASSIYSLRIPCIYVFLGSAVYVRRINRRIVQERPDRRRKLYRWCTITDKLCKGFRLRGSENILAFAFADTWILVQEAFGGKDIVHGKIITVELTPYGKLLIID